MKNVFELESATKVKVLDVFVLTSKDRKPGDPPGAQLSLQATLGPEALAMFDGFLPSMIYQTATNKAQGDLDGMPSLELTSIGERVKRMPWDYEQTGCTVTIDFGIGGPSNIVLSDCKAHRVSIAPKQSGVVVQWAIDAPALTDATRGQLTGLKSTEIQMQMRAPTAESDPQASIPGAAPAPTGSKVRKVPKGEAAAATAETPADGSPPPAANDATSAFIAAVDPSKREGAAA